MAYCGLKETGTTLLQTINRCIHGTMKHPQPSSSLILATKEELSKSSFSTPPTKSLVPPGKCQYNQTFQPSKLLQKWQVSHTSSILRFELPDVKKSLGLSTCACILAKATFGGEDVIRPYTPISTNELIGSFDLLVKDYAQGKMSRHLSTMQIGDVVEFKHIPFNVKLQAPFPYKKIGMIVGGTGITPMIQALHAILGDENNPIEVTMLYGSRESSDILGFDLLAQWEKDFGKFKLINVLSHEPESSKWDGERGFISKDLITKYLPDGDDTCIFVCGPPVMYDVISGGREDEEVKGLLKDLGYSKDQVYKF